MEDKTNNIGPVSQALQDLVYLIQVSALDQTLKDLLVRHLLAEGLTPAVRKEIVDSCLDGLAKIKSSETSGQIQASLQNDEKNSA